MTDKLKCFAGFDPGKSGAFAFYFNAAPEMIAAEDFPLVNGEIDAATLADRLRQMRPDFAIIERVGAMPKQGVSSTFLAREIPPVALDIDPGRPAAPVRAARVVFAERYFDFAAEHDEDARPALCVIARDEFGVVDDLVAFDARGHIGRWLGRAVLLGEQMRFFPRVESPALRVFVDPWEWLRAERRGVVILDRGRARWRLGENISDDDLGSLMESIRIILHRRVQDQVTGAMDSRANSNRRFPDIGRALADADYNDRFPHANRLKS
ncbi:MAG: hypothetical protein ACLPSW_12835 [Roseiarcus sp.]